MAALFAISVISYNYLNRIPTKFISVRLYVDIVRYRTHLDLVLQNPESSLLPALTRGGPLADQNFENFLFLQSRNADTRFQRSPDRNLRLCSDEGVNTRPCIMQTVSQSQPPLTNQASASITLCTPAGYPLEAG